MRDLFASTLSYIKHCCVIAEDDNFFSFNKRSNLDLHIPALFNFLAYEVEIDLAEISCQCSNFQAETHLGDAYNNYMIIINEKFLAVKLYTGLTSDGWTTSELSFAANSHLMIINLTLLA